MANNQNDQDKNKGKDTNAGNFANDREKASEAGKKGGQARAQNQNQNQNSQDDLNNE